jgi:serine/threonine-protein kinase RsbW
MHEPAACRVTAPPPLAWSRTYPGTAEHVRDARRFLAGVLAGHPATDDAVLCLSELASNAVIHSNSRKPDGVFTVRAGIGHSGRVHVEVEDQGGPWAQPLHTDGLHGRGLLIVGYLARDFGVSGDSDTGWTVWFEID